VAKAVGIASTCIFSQQIYSIRKQERGNGDNPRCYEQFAIAHRRQQRKDAEAELRMTEAIRISRNG
jgi:hypothetical protein